MFTSTIIRLLVAGFAVIILPLVNRLTQSLPKSMQRFFHFRLVVLKLWNVTLITRFHFNFTCYSSIGLQHISNINLGQCVPYINFVLIFRCSSTSQMCILKYVPSQMLRLFYIEGICYLVLSWIASQVESSWTKSCVILILMLLLDYLWHFY